MDSEVDNEPKNELLCEIRQLHEARNAQKCIRACLNLLLRSDKNTDSEFVERLVSSQDLEEDVVERLINEEKGRDINGEEDVNREELLLYLTISLIRLGRYGRGVRRMLETLKGGRYALIVKEYYEGVCDFLKEAIESNDWGRETKGEVVGVEIKKLDWYQYSGRVVICIYGKNITRDILKAKVTLNRHLSVLVSLKNNEYYLYDMPFLSHEITSGESSNTPEIKASGNKVEIELIKKDASIAWKKLLMYDNLERFKKENSNDECPPPLYKKSSKWEKEIKETVNEEIQSDDSLEAMFRKIYESSSDDVKRAMLKSYYESSGTCLSTNWGEVSKKKVEVAPPEGTECKKFR